MGLITNKPLSVIKSEVGGLFDALDTQTKARNDAGGQANSLTSALNSPSTDVTRIHTLKAQLDGAKAAKAGASEEVKTIKEKIMRYIGELNGRLKDVCKAIETLKKDLMEIKEVYEALRFFNESIAPLQKGRKDIKKFIRDINEGLRRHHGEMLGGSGSSGKTMSIDDLLPRTKTNTKNTPSNYGFPLTAASTINYLDAEPLRKGFYLQAEEYNRYNSNPSENQQPGDVSDIFRHGNDYTPIGNHSNYQIKLSNHLDRILQGRHSSRSGVFYTQMY
jgi:hypothetical protein